MRTHPPRPTLVLTLACPLAILLFFLVITHAAQLDKIFRANPGAIAISRQSDGCFLDANPAYLQMLGYARDELVGRTSIDLGILSAAARAQIVDHSRHQRAHAAGRDSQ